MKVIALASLKGGVGKTSTAVNLAAVAAAEGRSVLLWDLDPQAGATWCLGLDLPEGGTVKTLASRRRALDELMVRSPIKKVRVVRADLSLRRIDVRFHGTGRPARQLGRLLERMAKSVDVVILDTAPGAGVVTDSLPLIADLIVVPTQPNPMALRALDMLITQLGRDVPVVALLNGVDPRKPSHRRLVNEAMERGDVMTTTVPESSAVERLAAEREPTVLSAPASAASAAYVAVWAEITERLGI